jgi:hypothetical protein
LLVVLPVEVVLVLEVESPEGAEVLPDALVLSVRLDQIGAGAAGGLPAQTRVSAFGY